ncbi:kinase [Bacillus albus]|uniref:kinase n=1 Tax=Bacillus TaxID=1386 RepID=UPI0020019D34|nr:MULTISPECIES: kinase [Bacillus]MDA2025535.1 kinase [Bacillus cereus group sp. Bcc03]MDA2216295.1 kinase [Bacillus cereus group sp. Bc228]MDA2230201.1 kinase [Bacillus cereus group sp. Bc227]MDA2260292.1 kinase [Bacillus cereus group sp. Bc200]MDA2324367.1 kinase [Bacillus cereus group sp. Bc177]
MSNPILKSTLIILIGNSASGKTTIAKQLQEHFGHGTLLVSQDVVRRDMLRVHDTMGNLSHDLLFEITKYGKGKCEFVILEGILNSRRYGEMLKELILFFEGNAYTYYFDLSLNETIRRHNTREKRHEFGEDSLQKWYNPHDTIKVARETIFTDNLTQKDIFDTILTDVAIQK